jgi:hypothetical protein
MQGRGENHALFLDFILDILIDPNVDLCNRRHAWCWVRSTNWDYPYNCNNHIGIHHSISFT